MNNNINITSSNVNVWQSWENLIDYVKGELGAPILNIELDDDQIMDILKKHVLPIFSRYSPNFIYYFMFENEHCIQEYPTKIYQVKDFPYAILRVDEIIGKPSLIDWNQNISVAMYSGDITNLLGTNYTLQSKLEVMAQDTYRFIAPDKIELIKADNSMWIYDDFIVKFACIHDNPSTVDPDLYEYLKKWSLGEIMVRLGRIRSKFQSFATPVGQIDMDSQELKQEGDQLKREVKEELDRIPPDHYVFFLN